MMFLGFVNVCACSALCSICVIANALYARKMIAILPPRGTYAAVNGLGGERSGIREGGEGEDENTRAFYPGRVHRAESHSRPCPPVPLRHVFPYTHHVPASPQKARVRHA